MLGCGSQSSLTCLGAVGLIRAACLVFLTLVLSTVVVLYVGLVYAVAGAPGAAACCSICCSVRALHGHALVVSLGLV